MADTDYTPVACALHDQYEIAIMHKSSLLIRWQDGSAGYKARVLPRDIRVANGEEFLFAEVVSGELAGQSIEIRLDRISLVNS